jgi:TetR/AcrR family transcriptional repressor of uid operon
MPKLKPDTQRARREHILDAAEHCFARAGFHRCTMHDICKEAGISPGALYVYFSSKEALIAGIAERNRADFAARFTELAEGGDVVRSLGALAQHYFVDEPAHKQLMFVEIGVEATRNPQVGEIYRSVDEFCTASFEALFERLLAERRINPELDIKSLTRVFEVIGDGLFWRRATDPNFDAAQSIPAVMRMIEILLGADVSVQPSTNTRVEAKEAIQ